MSSQPTKPRLQAARFSPAAGIAGFFHWFSSSRKKYRTELWIMIAGIVVIAFIVAMTLFPHVFTRFDPNDQNAGGQMTAPSSAHIMGTDNLSRDVWARMVYGAQTILGVAIAAALMSAIIGIPLGLLSGFAGGVFDRILSLVMDSVYSFPGLILAIAFAAMLGPGIINITMAVAVVYIPTYFRLVRGQTLAIKEEMYVEAARAIGARRGTILSRYVFPNVIATVVVILSLNIADAIMTEAALSYIGLGLPAGIPDWGMDLSMGKKFLPSGVWWMITFPGLMIMLLALGFTMLGEGLAEILNPRLLER
ncbi:MAG: ABC transporter permease [Spirochaetia bacterium]|jgi:peptide/nickel transport system permease protein